MTPRVTDNDVRECTGTVDSGEGDTEQAIKIADIVVTNRVAAADSTLSAEELAAIEVYLAAHFFYLSLREGPLAAETIDNTSERYHNIYSKGLNATRFGQQAVMLDPTGVLAVMADKADNPQRKTALFQVVSPVQANPDDSWWPWWAQ